MIELKKGASLRVALQFTEYEWDSLPVISEIHSDFRQEMSNGVTVTVPLEVRVDYDLRTIFLSAETGNWQLGVGFFDVMIISEGLVCLIPALQNIEILLVEGIT